mgnify:CR=1 FL=1
MKKGQISTEVMYSIGVMIFIFIILTGISFNRRSEVRKLDEFIEKRNECLKIANLLTSINTFGDISIYNNTQGYVKITLKNYADILTNGIIVVRDTNITPQSIEATCTFNAHIGSIDFSGVMYPSLTTLNPFTEYYIRNLNKTVHIFNV